MSLHGRNSSTTLHDFFQSPGGKHHTQEILFNEGNILFQRFTTVNFLRGIIQVNQWAAN